MKASGNLVVEESVRLIRGKDANGSPSSDEPSPEHANGNGQEQGKPGPEEPQNSSE